MAYLSTEHKMAKKKQQMPMRKMPHPPVKKMPGYDLPPGLRAPKRTKRKGKKK